MLARNRNILSFGLVAALVSGFSSCTEVPVDTQQLVNHQVHDEYVANFVAKYGQPSPNQTWDFSGRNDVFESDLPLPEVGTRAISSAAVITNETQLDPDIKWDVLDIVNTPDERTYINAVIDNTPESDWAPHMYETIDMWPWWTYGIGSYSLGIFSINPTNGSYGDGTQYYTNLPYTSYGSSQTWGYGNGNYGLYQYYMQQYGESYGTGVGARIDPSALNSDTYESVFWYATPFEVYQDADVENIKQYELKKFKEIETPYGALYWCFDCDHDGNYRDLICLVEPVTIKRYLIEDLGALDDFDFNDIVVDVTTSSRADQETGEVSIYKQMATVRAMGGTLDFSITIGNTTWSKSENSFDPTIAYNADAGTNRNVELASFEVQGWDPEANNISVTVKKKETTATGSNVEVSFPFPKAGEVPMIIAVSPTSYLYQDESGARWYWMPERESIPARLFTEESTTEP